MEDSLMPFKYVVDSTKKEFEVEEEKIEKLYKKIFTLMNNLNKNGAGTNPMTYFDTIIDVDEDSEHLFSDNGDLVKLYTKDGSPIYVTIRKGNSSRKV